ncbi:alpha-hydroxy-acid oxidizing protein [Castellaniella sp.]|uniref:alpha-hydroxy acid oxidase n=1 Tax=Castellaniella sp. TaxID=1955812 RepID=UPI00356AF08B
MNKNIFCLRDLEEKARRKLPEVIFTYIDSHAEDGQSSRRNTESFKDLYFVPRCLNDTSQRSSHTHLFEKPYSAPFGIAPMGIASLTAYQGDLALAKSAKAMNIPMILSGSSLIPLESIIDVAPSTWFQMYVPETYEKMAALIERVENANYEVLVVTVDFPVFGNRENEARSGFSTPLKLSGKLIWDGITHPNWLISTWLRTLLTSGVPHFENNYATRGAPILSKTISRDFSGRTTFDWNLLREVRKLWKGKLVIKGLLSEADVSKACAHGVNGVILSNHGGRQLDGAISPMDALPGAKKALSGDVRLMLDGGIRRGSDVLKAIALGADFVFVGRPFNYAAAVAGERGVMKAIEILMEEIDRNLALLGATSISELSPEFIYRSR